MSNHHALLSALEQSIDGHVVDVCVAFSGGVDSSVLLNACVQLKATSLLWQKINIHALHINHGISPHSDAWSEHCKSICASLDVSFSAVKLSLKITNRTSLEALARDARYKAIDNWVKNNFSNSAVVLLGQHQDDQVETFLLQLKRGAGIQGLASMPSRFQSKAQVVYLRPLLGITQSQIIEYARLQNLNWIEDESNDDLRFDRNFLRKSILPQINEKWPSFSKTVSRSASLCAQQSKLIKMFAQQSLESIEADSNDNFPLKLYEPHCLNIKTLKTFELELQQEVLRAFLSRFSAHAPSFAQLEQVVLLINAKEDALPFVSLTDIDIRRYQHYLIVTQTQDSETQEVSNGLYLKGDSLCYEHPLLGFCVEHIAKPNDNVFTDLQELTLTFAQLNLKLKADKNRPSKTIKQWCKEYSVPPWWRNKLPILSYRNEPIALVLSDKLLLSVESQILYSLRLLKTSEGSVTTDQLSFTPKLSKPSF